MLLVGEVSSEPTNQLAAWQEPRPPDGPDLLPIGGFFRTPAFQLRVCGVCGLVDWFVPPEHLEKVCERFTREDDSTAPH